MALRNINVFEQHLEKIVLAVAIAGAGFMAYMAREPMTLPEPHSDVNAKGIEPAIAEQNDANDKGRKALAAKVPNVTGGTEWVDLYHKLAGGYAESNPLGDIAGGVIEFGPKN